MIRIINTTHSFLKIKGTQGNLSFNAQNSPPLTSNTKTTFKQEHRMMSRDTGYLVGKIQHTNITPPYTVDICNTSVGGKLRYKYQRVNTSFLYLYLVVMYFPF
jgi:hypothetical protein